VHTYTSQLKAQGREKSLLMEKRMVKLGQGEGNKKAKEQKVTELDS
jgi:hypothetical protein